MTRDEIIARLLDTAPALKAEGLTGLAIFGSHARGDARPDSDIDVLVEVEPDSDFSLLDLVGVQHAIQDALGIETQATIKNDLTKRFSSRIADDIIKVF